MSYKVINVHPDLTPEERERIEREISRSVCRVFQDHDARIKKEAKVVQDDGTM